jgi:hypothetical protein
MFVVVPADWRAGRLWIEWFLIFQKMGLSPFFQLKQRLSGVEKISDGTQREWTINDTSVCP